MEERGEINRPGARRFSHRRREAHPRRTEGGLFSYSGFQRALGEIFILKSPIHMEVAHFKDGSMAVLNVGHIRFLPDAETIECLPFDRLSFKEF